MEQKHKDKFEWACAVMVTENEFVHEILLLMEKHPTDKIETMGVTVKEGRLHLYYNPEFFDSLPDPILFWVFQHEIYHLVLHHCTTRAPSDKREHDLHNIAADLAINCLIKESLTCKRYESACFPEKFGFETRLSLEKYMELLRKKFPPSPEEKNGDGEGGEGDPKGNQKPGSGKTSKKSSAGDSIPKPIDDHSGWSESEIAGEIIRNKIEEMEHRGKVWGNMPGDVKETILQAQKTEISWRKFLRNYLGLSISSNPKPTMKKPHRRYGYPFPGTKRAHKDKKLVAIDTSASVDDEQLSQFLAEINKLQKITPIDLVLFDTNIQKGPIPFKRKEAKYEFDGRGGTCFQCVMDLCEERKYKTVIMLTDGGASAVDKPKKIKDGIWVITKDGSNPCDWGKTVMMNLV